jgi:hypothetical protein
MLLRVVAAMAVVLMMAALMIAVVTSMTVLMIAVVTALAVLPMMTAMAVLTAMTVLTVLTALAMTMMATLPSLSCSRETQTQSNGRDGQEREFHVRIYHATGAFPLEGCAMNQVLPPWRATCAGGAPAKTPGIRLGRNVP